MFVIPTFMKVVSSTLIKTHQDSTYLSEGENLKDGAWRLQALISNHDFIFSFHDYSFMIINNNLILCNK
jgi:hypothetical protein